MKAEDAKDVNRIALEEGRLIDEALKRAVRKALLRHRQDGLPVVIYRDGKIVWVQPEELDL